MAAEVEGHGDADEPRILHLRGGGTSVVVDLSSARGPAVVHWGEELDDDRRSLAGLAIAARPQRVTGGLDVPSLPSVIATAASGWSGFPGWAGHRNGRGFSARFTIDDDDRDDSRAVLVMSDSEAALHAELEMRIGEAGLLWQRLSVSNAGADEYTVTSAQVTFPVPGDAVELLDTAGRWARERAPQRYPFTIGRHVRESRRGRPGSDATVIMAAGRSGFGFETGRVHGIHVAWSGNHRVQAERTVDGVSMLAGGELLDPGEIVLAPGESYSTPWVIGSWGEGLSQLSQRFHREWRARPEHPRRPRPITLNTWEAVYFDQDPVRLTALAEVAAEIGVERFVLDDGWFVGRRDDRAALGDWHVDPVVWPDGLHPLVDSVIALGMEFGLWVEPEMVSIDSDLARQHPEWILRARHDAPPMARGQQVLNLADPAAYDHVAASLSRLLAEYPISYLKWDHNRDLLDAGDGPGGSSQVHAHTRAVYRLIDELKAEHPGIEIESSASGGARVDLGMLSRVDRVWTSDSLDPVERLPIQRYTGIVVPPEMLGAHITMGRPGEEGRSSGLGLSAMVAMFGHVGVECDLTLLDEGERERLGAWIRVASRLRPLVAEGTRVDVDGVDPGLDVRGVVAHDRASAVFTIIQVSSGPQSPPSRVRLPGLDPDRRYRLHVLTETPGDGVGRTPLQWAAEPVVLSGRAAALIGVRPPVLNPQSGIVVELIAESESAISS